MGGQWIWNGVSPGLVHAPPSIPTHIYEELQPLVNAVYEATGDIIPLEIDRAVGIEYAEGGTGYRPATDDECKVVEFSIHLDCALDPCKPLFPQLSAWLTECANGIDDARNGIERIEGVRDVAVIPRKLRRA